MKKTALLILATLPVFDTFASPAATQDWTRHYVATSTWAKADNQDWVRHYVATNLAQSIDVYQTISTNTGLATIIYTNYDGNVISMTMKMRDKLALVVSNCTAAAVSDGITNGTLFAWNGWDGFTNEDIGRTIYNYDTEHYAYYGVQSVTNDVREYIPGYFDIYGTRIDREMQQWLLTPRGVKVEPKDPLWRRLLLALAEMAVPSAKADTWSGIKAIVHKPLYNSYGQNHEMLIRDSKGNEATVKYENGVVDRASLDNALSTLRSSVNDVLRQNITQGEQICQLDMKLQKLDKELTDTTQNINNIIEKLIGEITSISEKQDNPDGNGQREVEVKIIERTKDRIVFERGGVAAAKTDDKSIEVTDPQTINAKYRLKNFPNTVGSKGKIPYYDGSELSWFFLRDLFDDESIKCETDGGYSSIVEGGIRIAGWDKPTDGDYKCDDTVASMLTNATEETSHYFLTRYGNDGQVHYTRAGRLLLDKTPGGGGAIRIFGIGDSVGTVLGEGSVTNELHFAAKNDSNVTVDVTGGGQSVTVTFGIYYK